MSSWGKLLLTSESLQNWFLLSESQQIVQQPPGVFIKRSRPVLTPVIATSLLR